jgi:hypothetical protein
MAEVEDALKHSGHNSIIIAEAITGLIIIVGMILLLPVGI